MTTIATMITLSVPRRSVVGPMKGPMSRPCNSPSHPPTEISLSLLKISFWKGMSSVNTKVFSAAAMTLNTTLPAMRHQCGRKKASSRR